MSRKQDSGTGCDPTGRTDGAPAPATPRRAVLRGIAAASGVGVTGWALAACGGGGTSGAGSAPSSSAPSSAAAGSGDNGALAKTADVPVGGGVVNKDAKIVVTQPQQGTFKGFSAVCTHQGCVVANVADGAINCGCHGSKFDVADGSVKKGPAQKPLAAVQVAARGSDVTRA